LSKVLLSIIQEDGHCNIDFRKALYGLTREEFNQVVKMTYYALKSLEENVIDSEEKPNE
jgi:hypothetical protein